MSAGQSLRRFHSLRRLRKSNLRFRKTHVPVAVAVRAAQRTLAVCSGASAPVTEAARTAKTAKTRRFVARVTERLLPKMFRISFTKCSRRLVFRLKCRLGGLWSRGLVTTFQEFACTPIHALLTRLEQFLLQLTQSATTLFLRAANINPRVLKVESSWRTNSHT
jgi:hypothetical protein